MRTRSVLALISIASIAGCTLDDSVGPGAQISCDRDGECPRGLVCREALGRCVVPSGSEEAPALVGQAVITPELATAGTRITVAFDVSTVLARLPVVRAQARSTTLAFEPEAAASTETHFVFSYLTNGTEPEGVARLDVDLLDAAGIAAIGLPLGSVGLDFTAPNAISMTVAYVPGAGNPLPVVQRATAGTTVIVSLAADEPLGPAAPTLTASNGTDTLTFAVTNRSALGVTFQALVAPGTSSGTYLPALGWSDAAGNFSAAAPLPATRPDILVATELPALAIDQSQVRFLRSPWGNGASEALDGGFVIPAGPYFALAPFESLSGIPELPMGTFTFPDAGSQLGRVRVWAGPDGGALLGSMDPTGTGWPRLQLAEADVPAAYASGIDEAGNESPRQKLLHAEWVASPRPNAIGANPHGIFGVRLAQPTRVQLEAIAPGTSAHARDGTSFSARADPAWQRRDLVVPVEIPERNNAAIAFDAARGRLVAFGGFSGNELQDTWEWDGATWRDRTPLGFGPRARTNHSMAYDSARGRVVLFGGYASPNLELQDTWEWDGQTWVEKALPGGGGALPPGRSNFAMAYDSARGRTVLFGGQGVSADLDDIWEWDGARWQQPPRNGAWPAARENHALAYDSARGRVVLFGGASGTKIFQDTWEWDGTSWLNRTPAGTNPPAQQNHAMAFDPVRGRVVLNGLSGQTWEWDGTDWVNKNPPLSPGNSSRHSMAFDGVRKRVVRFGGSFYSRETWEWDGTTWADKTPQNIAPSARSEHAMAWDAVRERAVLFGGYGLPNYAYLQDTWEWDGTRWFDRSDAGTAPSPRSHSAMAWDPERQRVVLFSGDGVAVGADTWEWGGAGWVNNTDGGTAPPARQLHSMAYDSARKRLVVFGGDGGGALQDTWERNGTNWAQAAPSGAIPSPRSGMRMTYDPLRGQTVLFGGYTAGRLPLQDSWEWDGGSWTDKTPAGAKPAPRNLHALAWDSTRQRTVMFGGEFNLQDEWEWDGTGWVDKSASSPRPSGRSSPAMTYDSARGHLVLFGGYSGTYVGDTWVRDSSPQRQPAVQFEARGFGLPPSSIAGMRVRAWCGGRFSPYGATDVGATVHGWASGLSSNTAQGWVPLASNASAPGASPIDWVAPSATEATRLYFEPGFAVQCRPAGTTGVGANDAEVSLDYLEVRVRYSAP